MKRECKICGLPQELDAFVKSGRYRLHTCKLCYNGARPPRVSKERTDEQKAARKAARRKRYWSLRRRGFSPSEAARAH